MRPRRIRRGEHGLPERQRRQRPGFNAATANSPWRTRSIVDRIEEAIAALQCGHGEFAVENFRPARVVGAGDVRFNAATANSPWRTTSPAAWATCRSMVLQCG